MGEGILSGVLLMNAPRKKEADPYMAVKWETIRVSYFKRNPYGNEQRLEDAEFQLDRWRNELNKQLEVTTLID